MVVGCFVGAPAPDSHKKDHGIVHICSKVQDIRLVVLLNYIRVVYSVFTNKMNIEPDRTDCFVSSLGALPKIFQTFRSAFVFRLITRFRCVCQPLFQQTKGALDKKLHASKIKDRPEKSRETRSVLLWERRATIATSPSASGFLSRRSSPRSSSSLPSNARVHACAASPDLLY